MVFPNSSDAQEIPEINRSIVDYVSTTIGTKVNRGECWDLAYEALTRNNCKWDGKYAFGELKNPKTDSIYPGDIVQFSGVTLTYKKDGLLYKESMKHHTAIIYEVNPGKRYVIAHQNNGFSGKKVGLSALNLEEVTAGKLMFYRPVSN